MYKISIYISLIVSFLYVLPFYFSAWTQNNRGQIQNSSNLNQGGDQSGRQAERQASVATGSQISELETLWQGLNPGSDIEMLLVDDFEERVKWRVETLKPITWFLRFVKRVPESDYGFYADKKVHPLFAQDLDILKKSAEVQHRTPPAQQFYAQELQIFVSDPGKDAVLIRIPESIHQTWSGRPVALALWVYGTRKKERLYAVISNSVRKDNILKLTDLDFEGWKRVEVAIPVYLQKRNRNKTKSFDFRLEGLKLVTHASQEEGPSLFMFDLVMVLVDHGSNQFPGYKIRDEWK